MIVLADSANPYVTRAPLVEFTGYKHTPGWTGGRMQLHNRVAEPWYLDRVSGDAASAFFFQLDLIQHNEWFVEGYPVSLGRFFAPGDMALEELEELRKSGRLPESLSAQVVFTDFALTLAEGKRRSGAQTADMGYALDVVLNVAGLHADLPPGARVRRMFDQVDTRPPVSPLVAALATCTDPAVAAGLESACRGLERAVVEYGELLRRYGVDASAFDELARRFRPAEPALLTAAPTGGRNQAPGGPGTDLVASLERLAAQCQSGALSQDEYEALKAQLLKSLT